jgi:hypothetical protein
VAEEQTEAPVAAAEENANESATEPVVEETAENTTSQLHAEPTLQPQIQEEKETAAADDTANRPSESLAGHVADVVSSRIPDDTQEEHNTNPVVGYLVCIDGIHKGNSYNVMQGRNFIGRSTAMDICLAGNQKINRDRHAIVIYDPRSKNFFFQPDESRDLIYVNDKLLFGPEPLKHEDIIFMGDEKFVFLQLQSSQIDWI